MTNTKQPTEAQIREFWEWFEWKKNPMAESSNDSFWYPPIDLNNLFKYAVPKLNCWSLSLDDPDDDEHDENLIGINTIAEVSFRVSGTDWKYGYIINKDPALALFWAIWEVIHNDTG